MPALPAKKTQPKKEKKSTEDKKCKVKGRVKKDGFCMDDADLCQAIID